MAKYLTLLCAIFFLSCSGQKNVQVGYRSDGFRFSDLKGSSVRLNVSPVIDPGMFAGAFDREYYSTYRFNNRLTGILKEKLGNFSKVTVDSSDATGDFFFIPVSSDRENPKVKQLFEKMGETYLVGITQVVFYRNAAQASQSPQISVSTTTTRSRPMTRTSTLNDGIQTSECATKIVGQVWSVKERKKVAEFSSVGESKVHVFMYGRAMNDALEESLTHAADFIDAQEE